MVVVAGINELPVVLSCCTWIYDFSGTNKSQDGNNANDFTNLNHKAFLGYSPGKSVFL